MKHSLALCRTRAWAVGLLLQKADQNQNPGGGGGGRRRVRRAGAGGGGGGRGGRRRRETAATAVDDDVTSIGERASNSPRSEGGRGRGRGHSSAQLARRHVRVQRDLRTCASTSLSQCSGVFLEDTSNVDGGVGSTKEMYAFCGGKGGERERRGWVGGCINEAQALSGGHFYLGGECFQGTVRR